MKPRILIVSPFPPIIGGISVSSERLFRNLSDDEYEVDSYNILKFGHNKYWKFFIFLLIPFYILFHKKYDIIHFHVPSRIRKLYVVFFKSWYKGAKVVFTLHGDVTNLIHDKMTIWALNKADKIICVKNGDSNKMPLQIKEKSCDIPAYIRPKNISHINTPSAVLEFINKGGDPLLVFYGRIHLAQDLFDLYGIEDVLNLCDYLDSIELKYRLLLLIDYNNTNPLEVAEIQEISNKIINKQQMLLISPPNFSLMPVFKQANIYIRPTKTDGDSLAVREALSMGCAVVASDVAIRPRGAFVYSTMDEFKSLVVKLISSPMKINQDFQQDNYSLIKNLYHELTEL